MGAAGYGQVGTVEEVSPDQLRDQFETNVVGLVQVIQAVLPHMRERGRGHIINIGSMGGHVSLPTMAVYCASKSAVQNLSEGLAKEVGPLGIHVTLVELTGYNTSFGTNAKLPATSIPAYAPSYAAMAAFDQQAVRGDLVKSMAAVADITGIDEPPLHLAVATAGLEMVRGRFAELMDEYACWEPVTASTPTDGEQRHTDRPGLAVPSAARGRVMRGRCEGASGRGTGRPATRLPDRCGAPGRDGP